MTLADRLRNVPLLRNLPADAFAALAQELAQRRLGAGEVLFCQGDAGAECFVILDGSLEVLTYINGAEHRLEIYRAGQLIGEMALIDRSPRSATVRALEPSTLVVLTEREFVRLIGSSPDTALAMLRNSTMRVRNTNQRMIGDLERKNAELLAAYQQLQAAQAELIRLNRLEEELAVARRIQESFLPRRLPQPPGWQLAGFSRGAQAVGGDFYDCIELADGRLGLVVADACGKGVTAALFVALTRSLLRAASLAPTIFHHTIDAGAAGILTAALQLTNDYICREHADSNMFITLFYGLLDPASGELAYVNAGHNPPLLLGAAEGEPRELAEGTLPLGILADQSYPVQQVRLMPGDRLVAFSDGITEAMNAAGELFDDARLHAVLREYGALNAADLVTTIVAATEAHAAGAPQADDMTLLVVARARADEGG
jgi:serine phosphatase RsbU (regulator of sigma subunit)